MRYFYTDEERKRMKIFSIVFAILSFFIFDPIQVKIEEEFSKAFSEPVSLNWNAILYVEKKKIETKLGANEFLQTWGFEIFKTNKNNEVKGINQHSEDYWGDKDWGVITFNFDQEEKLKDYKIEILEEKIEP